MRKDAQYRETKVWERQRHIRDSKTLRTEQKQVHPILYSGCHARVKQRMAFVTGKAISDIRLDCVFSAEECEADVSLHCTYCTVLRI